MDDNFMLLFMEKNQIEALKKTNAYTSEFGLCLTDDDIQKLLNDGIIEEIEM